jgi:hypothetical protein
MPYLGDLNDEYAEAGLQIIGVVTDVYNRKGELISETFELARAIIEETGADYLHIIPSVSLGKVLLNSMMYVPTTIFVDENGKQISDHIVGSKTKNEWIEIINSMLEQVS